MKEIREFSVDRVISEPGDMTRYDYLITQNGDDFLIAPYKNTFHFPQRLNYWNVVNIDDVTGCVKYINANIATSPELVGVNPNTLLEVIDTIKLLYNQ
jgi:hypothetical protein